MALVETYKLNTRETETHLLEFLNSFTEETWIKLNKLPPKEIDKVLFRTFLRAMLSTDVEKCRFVWEKIVRFRRERYVLFESNHLALQIILKNSFDATIFTWFLTRTNFLTVDERDLFNIKALSSCLDLHGKLFENKVCSHAKQLNLIWEHASTKVQSEVMNSFKRTTKIILISILKEKELLENPLVTRYFNLSVSCSNRTGAIIQSSCVLILSDPEKEETLTHFIDFFLNSTEVEQFSNEWEISALFDFAGEDFSRAMLRFYLVSVTNSMDAKFDFGWYKVRDLGIAKKLLEFDEFCVIKMVLDMGNRKMLRRFLVVVSDRLTLRKIKQMLRAAFKHCIHYHYALYHGVVWDSTKSTQMLVRELKTVNWTDIASEVVSTMRLKDKKVLKWILPDYNVLEEVPMLPINFSDTLLLPEEHETNLVTFLKVMQQKPELLQKYWTRYGLNSLSSEDAFKAHYRALLIAMFCDDPPNLFEWVWEKLGTKKNEVFDENEYHICIIMTASEFSIIRLFNKARECLERPKFILFLRKCFEFIAKQHGKLYSGKVWNGIPSLKRFRNKCTAAEWGTIFSRYFS